MTRLNQTLMLEEQLEQAMVQERDMQAAYELETAESDELQYMAALLEEKDGQDEETLPPCDHLGRWARLRTSGLRGRPFSSSANSASSSSADAAPMPVHGQDDHQVVLVPDSQDQQGVSLSCELPPARDASASRPRTDIEW